jgi:hypothetical protein
MIPTLYSLVMMFEHSSEFAIGHHLEVPQVVQRASVERGMAEMKRKETASHSTVRGIEASSSSWDFVA